MKLKQAFDRLKFTISKQNKPNEKDIEAFNKLAEYFDKQNKDVIQENLLFAKLYAYLLAELTNYYNDVDFANKQINKILQEPLGVRIEILKMDLKNIDTRNYFIQRKILDPFLQNKSYLELEEIYKRYENKLPQLNANDFLKCLNNWDYNSVVYNLETNINLSITNFKNNV